MRKEKCLKCAKMPKVSKVGNPKAITTKTRKKREVPKVS
jgi:hypothetical protein